MNLATRYGKKSGQIAAVLLASLYAAAASAQATDPTTAVIAKITEGQGWGVLVAVAVTVAYFAIRAVKMTRKG